MVTVVSGSVVRRALRRRAARDGARRSWWCWRAGGQAARAARGATVPRRAARAAERREWAQRGRAIAPTCAGRAAAGVNAKTCLKDAEQEEWHNPCRRRECRRPKGLRLAQAESERAVSVGTGGRAGTEAGAGRRATRDAAVVPERTRDIGAADEPALVAMRHSEL